MNLAAQLLAAGCLMFAIWAFAIEPNRLVVNESTLAIAEWPGALNGLRIVLLSDLHVGSAFIDAAKLRQIVAEVNELQPDLIMIAGDFMIDDVIGGRVTEPEVFAGELKNMRARHGIYAVLGNHDWSRNGNHVIQALGEVGIRVLEDDAHRIEQNNQALWLVGLADLWTRNPDIGGTLRKVIDDNPIIALSHNPDIFPSIPPRVILTLAGHTHGGQVALPLVGRLVVPSLYKQRYAIGHVMQSNKHLFVTSGIGTSIIPLRFGVPPEISVLTIESAN